MKILAWLLIYALFIPPQYSFADPIDEVYESVKKSYYHMIVGELLGQVEEHYLFRSADFSIAAHYLMLEGRQRVDLLNSYAKDWSGLKTRLNSHPSELERNAHRLYTLMNFSRIELNELEILKQEFQSIGQTWENRCSNKKIEEQVSYWDPFVQFPIDDIGGTPKIGKLNFSVAVTYGTGGWGMDGKSKNSDPKKEKIAGAAGGLGAGLISTGHPAAVAVGVVLIVAAFIYGFLADALKRASLVEHHNETIKAIRSKMRGDTGKLASGSKQMIEDACETRLTDSLEFKDGDRLKTVYFSEMISEFVAGIDHQMTAARTWYDEMSIFSKTLNDKIKRYYTYLDEIYYPKLKAEYLDRFKRDFEARKKLDRDAIGYVTKKVSGLVKILSDENQHPFEKARVSQIVWDRMIQGDAVFNLNDQPLEPEKRFSIWGSTLSDLKTRFSQ